MLRQLQVQATALPRAARLLVAHDSYDLILLSGLAMILPVLVLAPIPVIAVVLGLAAVVLAPGYVLTAAIFAQRDDLDGVERAALSFGLSVAVVPLLALLLDRLPWGIRPLTMGIAVTVWLLAGCGMAAWRRHRLAVWGKAYLPPQLVGRWRPWRGTAQRRDGIVAVAILSVLVWGFAIGLAPTLTARITEFYALGAAGRAEGYPRAAAPGEEVRLRVGVANREGTAGRYRVEVRAQGRAVGHSDWFLVDDGAVVELPLLFSLAQAGDDQRIDILLFRADRSEPYRRLHLLIDVREPPPDSEGN